MIFLELPEDILCIDYSGVITLEIGISNMNILERKVYELFEKNNCVRLIYDFRNTVWPCFEDKYQLSQLAYEKFRSQYNRLNMKVAILNNKHNAPSFEGYHFFLEMDDALRLLNFFSIKRILHQLLLSEV